MPGEQSTAFWTLAEQQFLGPSLGTLIVNTRIVSATELLRGDLRSAEGAAMMKVFCAIICLPLWGSIS